MGSLLFASWSQKSQIITDTRFDSGVQTTIKPPFSFIFLYIFEFNLISIKDDKMLNLENKTR